VFDKKSDYSFKEVMLPIAQVLFYFTEEQVKESDPPSKGAVIFLRSCDLHAVKRLDEIYLNNGAEDYYYKRARDKILFVLMGCKEAFDSCFCVDMGTNHSLNYDLSVEPDGEDYLVNYQGSALEWEPLFQGRASKEITVTPSFVTETKTRVALPERVPPEAASLPFWEEYDGRCINCGRCNFVCPTCTCFTMQDLFYTETCKAGERRRVWASCMVDGFTGVAGGGSYRQKNGQRIRFRAFHKIADFKERFGYHMCVGCGRCDDICPEYISFSNTINKLTHAIGEVQ
jgi:anaerobic sulfite reductase subunit A